MIAGRYTGRPSMLSKRISNGRSKSLKQISKKLSSKFALKPIDKLCPKIFKQQQLSEQEDPVDELESQTVLTNVTVAHIKNHKDLVLPIIQEMPAFGDQSFEEIFSEKLQLCCSICNFSDNEADVSAKRIKSETLLEIEALINEKDVVEMLSPSSRNKLLSMISTNIFRSFHPIPDVLFVRQDEPIIVDVDWPHLSIIYLVLIKYQSIVPNDSFFSGSFARSLIKLLHSCDIRERKQILNFLIKYCDTFPDREVEIWSELHYLLIGYREGLYRPFCVSTILSFYLKRFSRSNTPCQLATEIFIRGILPLISCRHILAIIAPLMEICQIFLDANQTIAIKIAEELIKRFPYGCAEKQVTHICIQNALINQLTIEQFCSLMPPILRVYGNCLDSPNSRVVETALLLWTNAETSMLMRKCFKDTFPTAYIHMNKAMNNQWSFSTRAAVRKVFISISSENPVAFGEIKHSIEEYLIQNENGELPSREQNNWVIIARQAWKVDHSICLGKILGEVQSKLARGAALAPLISSKKRQISEKKIFLPIVQREQRISLSL